MSISDEIKSMLVECQSLHGNGKYQQAEALALWCIAQSGAIDDDVLLFRSYSALGHILRASEKFAEALNVLTTALTLAQTKLGDEQVAKAWNNLGGLFLGGCAWQLAIECFHKIINDEVLCKTVDAHKAYGNAALCHLRCGNITNGLNAIRRAMQMAPDNFQEIEPYCYLFRRNTLVQLALISDRIELAELANALDDLQFFSALRASNRRIDLLCDLIEGGVTVAYGADRGAGIKQLYLALQKAQFVHELLTDVLGCLVQAEFLAGRTDKMQQHLESWIARTYEDAGWQAAEKLGLHNTRRIGQVLQEQWPELQLGEQNLTPSLMSGPPLPPGLMERFSDWVAQEAKSDTRTVDISLVLKGELVRLPLLRLLAEGLDRQQIAARLCLTQHSVKTMLLRLYRALGVANREAAIAFWQEHHQSLTEAARNQPGCLSWYRARLLRHEFEAALLHWHNTPPHLRDSRARLLICLMLSLLKREDAAAKESAYLLPADAALFLPFNDWWQGDEAALPRLLQVANADTASRGYCLKLALYFGCTLRKQYKHAAALIGALKTDLGTTPALVGEGEAPCPDAG